MQKTTFLWTTTALFGALAVALGAFGAHGLRPYLNEYQHAIYEKAVFYQFVHVLASFGALFAAHVFGNPKLQTASVLFLLGIVLFSGSLYLLAVNTLLPLPKYILGPVTPVGGVLFISGWLWLAYCFSQLSFSGK